MKNSTRFKQLIERVNFLTTNLLPDYKLDGEYSDIEKDLIKSYILLVHAEIESFLEDRVYEKFTNSFNNWKENRKKSTVINAINTFCNLDLNTNGKHSKSNKDNIEYRININIQYYKSMIYSNHGIKRENILNLLLPIGIEIDELDESWLSIMDSFGSERGNYAHKSHVAIENIRDPNSIKLQLNQQILPILKDIDNKLIKIT